jgi:hypothetical protein
MDHQRVHVIEVLRLPDSSEPLIKAASIRPSQKCAMKALLVSARQACSFRLGPGKLQVGHLMRMPRSATASTAWRRCCFLCLGFETLDQPGCRRTRWRIGAVDGVQPERTALIFGQAELN